MNAEGIHIRGVGAVSAAGWSAGDLLRVVRENTPLPATQCVRPGDSRPWPCAARLVPAPPLEKAARHPRLRRASAITRYSVAAALEALADAGHQPGALPNGIGILFVMMNGCVNYTGRFFQEVLQNPAQASPLIFPETVFNAPASHIASFLGIDGTVSTLVGSPNTLMEAMDTAACWIRSGIVEECLLIAAEECDWLSAEALTYYHPKLIATEGAGALLLSSKPQGPRVSKVVGPMCYTSWKERASLLPELAEQTRAVAKSNAILIDDRTGITRIDRAEADAWASMSCNTVRSPKTILGESMGANCALKLAVATLETRETGRETIISMPGTNTAAYACVIEP
jgi:hypothetical protein